MRFFVLGLLIVGCSVIVYLQVIKTTPGLRQTELTKALPVQSEPVPTEKLETVKEESPVVSLVLPEQKKVITPSTIPLRDLSESVISPQPYHEFVNPSSYLHTAGEPITIGEQVGKKIILLSFITYSCINCQRTFPTLVRLQEQYRDEGLLVIGIHTPEFAFEHDAKRVQDALSKYGITFPIVLDNKYETWNAYQNRFWPRRFVIDAAGQIIYDHIGEGDYDGLERVIKALLPTLPAV